jgi:hypothetical protein
MQRLPARRVARWEALVRRLVDFVGVRSRIAGLQVVWVRHQGSEMRDRTSTAWRFAVSRNMPNPGPVE